MGLLNYPRLQSIFYGKVKEHSPAKATVKLPSFTHVDAYSAFTGDGEVTYPFVFQLHCLYRLNPTPDYRKRYGIDENTTAVLHVPMLELQAVMNTHLQRAYELRQQLWVEFFGEVYDVVLVRAYEPFGDGFDQAIGWEFQLKQKEDKKGK
jgi:hypothetical protein